MAVRLSPKERILIDRAATLVNKGVSTYLRDLALRAANETLTRRGA